MRLSEICEALELPKGRVDQWAHRGLLAFDKETKPGSARQCTKADAARIAMLGYLSAAGVSFEAAAQEIAQAMKGLFIYENDVSFLVISATRIGELISPTQRGGPGQKAGEGVKIVTDCYFKVKAIPGSQLAELASCPDFDFSMVFNLTEIETRVDDFWIET